MIAELYFTRNKLANLDSRDQNFIFHDDIRNIARGAKNRSDKILDYLLQYDSLAKSAVAIDEIR